MKTLLLALALLASPAFAEETAAPAPAAAVTQKQQDIRRLLDLLGTEKLAQVMTDQMMASMRAVAKGVPDEFWDELRKELTPGSLTELLVPVYDQRFSEAEIQQLIAMLQTPIGQKYISELPAVQQDAMAAGQEWGRAAAERAMARMRKRESTVSRRTRG
jgi:hypothetical protein